MNTHIAFAGSFVAALAVAAVASAETLEFSYSPTTTNTYAAIWTQPSDPVPLATHTTSIVVDVDGIESIVMPVNGIDHTFGQHFSALIFYDTALYGGFRTGGRVSTGDSGEQLFTGPNSAPVFAPGTFHLDGGVLTVTAIPEPAAWVMMILGLAGVGGALRARRIRAAAAT